MDRFAVLFGMSRVTFDDNPLRLLKSDRIELKWLEEDFAHLEHTALIVAEGEDLLTREAVNGIRKIAEGAAGDRSGAFLPPLRGSP